MAFASTVTVTKRSVLSQRMSDAVAASETHRGALPGRPDLVDRGYEDDSEQEVTVFTPPPEILAQKLFQVAFLPALSRLSRPLPLLFFSASSPPPSDGRLDDINGTRSDGRKPGRFQ